MYNLSLIDEYYKKYIKDVNYLIPEGIYSINLELLHQLDLLHFQPLAERKIPRLSQYFQIIESPEKITMVNDEFLVWIIPEKVNELPVTYVLIALNSNEQEPQLEVAFMASGVYNTTKIVLKVLEKFLIDIQETERVLANFKKSE